MLNLIGDILKITINSSLLPDEKILEQFHQKVISIFAILLNYGLQLMYFK